LPLWASPSDPDLNETANGCAQQAFNPPDVG